MTQATGSSSRIIIAKETTFATVPITGWQQISMATFGESLNQTAEELRSNTIKGGRGLSNFRNGLINSDGSIAVELSGNGTELFFEGLCGSKSGNGTTIDPFVYKRGLTIPSFSIEKGHLDLNKYFVYKGFKINGLELNFEPGQFISGNFSFLGKGDLSSSNTSASASPTIFEHIGLTGIDTSLAINGIVKDNIVSFSLNIQNELKGQSLLNNKYSNSRISEGVGSVSGTLSMLFEDEVLFSDWLNEVEREYLLHIEYDGKVKEFYFPKVRLTGDVSVKIDTPDGLLYNVNWVAINDPTINSDFEIREWNV